MRALLVTLAATAALSLATPAVAGSHAAMKEEGSERVLHVDTRGNGPVHRQISLGLHKAAVVELDADTRDVLVSDPAVLDAVVRAPRRIFLLGRNIGQANAFFFDAQGRQLLAVDVRVEKDTGELASMIRAEIPDADVSVQSLNGSVVLSGTVNSPADAARAADIAARYAADPDKPEDKSHLVNMLRVKGGEQVPCRQAAP
jgi:pilus assembly protein CpaC